MMKVKGKISAPGPLLRRLTPPGRFPPFFFRRAFVLGLEGDFLLLLMCNLLAWGFFMCFVPLFFQHASISPRTHQKHPQTPPPPPTPPPTPPPPPPPPIERTFIFPRYYGLINLDWLSLPIYCLLPFLVVFEEALFQQFFSKKAALLFFFLFVFSLYIVFKVELLDPRLLCHPRALCVVECKKGLPRLPHSSLPA